MKITRFIFCFLLAMFLCGFGCSSPKPIPDPLAGWQKNYKSWPDAQAIEKDYQDYLKSLGIKPLKAGAAVIYASDDGSEDVGSIEYFEDGTGQHAVKITISVNHAVWEHILIYDKDNKRIKTIKYRSGSVSC